MPGAGEYRVCSGRYPLTAEPEELQRVVLEHARDLDQNVEHHKAHARRLKDLEEESKVHDATLTDISVRLAKLATEFKTTTVVAAGATTVLVTLAMALIQWVTK